MPGWDADSVERPESSVAPSRRASSEPEPCGLGFELPVQAEATKAAPTLPTPRRNCRRERVALMSPFSVPADPRLCGERAHGCNQERRLRMEPALRVGRAEPRSP